MTYSRIEIFGGATLVDDGRLTLTDGVASRGERRAQSGTVTSLPLDSTSVDTVVMTETLEYLDPGAVFRLLLEVHRVLRVDGRLLIEIPDIGAVLGEWNHETPRQLCTYRRHDDPPGVWRAPVIDAATLDAFRRSNSPMRVAIDLTNLVVEKEHCCRLGLQSAWNRDELAATLGVVGLQALSFDDTAAGQLSDGLLATPREGRLRCLAAPAPVSTAIGDLLGDIERAHAESRFHAGVSLARAGRHDDAMQMLQRAISEDPSVARRHYRLVWDLYVRALRATAGTAIVPSPTFATEGRHIGRIDGEVVADVRRALDRAPVVHVTAADAAPGYLSNPNLTSEAEAAINRDNTYFVLEPSTLDVAGPLFEALAEAVEGCLETPCRIVNVRAWRTEAHARRVEANGWHRDEPYPPEVLKVIVYLTDAGPHTGTTELVHTDGSHSIVVGPAGTFLAFQNSELVHRGVPPAHGTRAILEVTVTPHPTRDLRPVCAGQNADFPYSPWLALEQQRTPEPSASTPLS
ncbi:MAG: methyltransferase domain-containing protein [Dermatophilaceae bacterium]